MQKMTATTSNSRFEILHNSWLSEQDIVNAEEHYKAKYICDTCLKVRNGSYGNQSFAIFYNEVAHPNGSNWFALFRDNGRTMIVNAIEVENRIINGLVIDDSKVIYSSYRNDYRCYTSEKTGVEFCIDGGMDYLKLNKSSEDVQFSIAKLQVTKDGLRVFEINNRRS